MPSTMAKRDGMARRNQTCATGTAKSTWPMRSRRTMGAVVDGLGLGDLAVRPLQYPFGRCGADAHRVKLRCLGARRFAAGAHRAAALHKLDIKSQAAQGVQEYVKGGRRKVVRNALAADNG